LRSNTISKIIGLNLVVALLYSIFGYLGLLAAVPPGYATAIWAPSGIALGAVLVWGLPVLPGIWLGSFIINLYVAASGTAGLMAPHSMDLALWIALGAALQATVGALLINYYVGAKNQLLEARQILQFALITGPISCLINASWSNLALYAVGFINEHGLILSFTTWWAGDVVGALFITPLFLVLFARPRKYWRARFFPIFIPLVISFIGVIVLFFLVKQAEHDRVRDVFVAQVDKTVTKIHDQLLIAQTTTDSLATYLEVAPQITVHGFDAYTQQFIDRYPFLQALEWIPKVTDRATFIKNAKKTGMRNFSINEIQAEKLVTSAEREVYYPVYLVNPKRGNEQAIGFDLGSRPEHLLTLTHAIGVNRVVMSAPIKLVQSKAHDTGVLLFSPVVRDYQFKGFALGVINIDKVLDGILRTKNNYLDFVLTDITDRDRPLSIFSYSFDKKAQDKEVMLEKAPISVSRSMYVSGRLWNLHAKVTGKFYSSEFSWSAWLVLVGGVLFCILINIILFVIYGQRFTVELLVHQRTKELRREESKNLMLLQSAGEGIYGLDSEGVTTFLNQAAQDMLGYTEAELIGKSMHSTIHHSYPDGSAYAREDCPMYAAFNDGKVHRKEGEVLWRKDGTSFWVEYSSTPIKRNDEILGAVIVFNDVSEKRAAHFTLQKMAHYDSLTGLPNRVSFIDNLKKSVARANRKNIQIAVCFIDLDNFKQVNDTLGHIYGDRLLTAISERLTSACRDSDYLARLGGDEFALILELITSADEIPLILERYMETIRHPLVLDAHTLNTSMSVGIALFPEGGGTPEDLIKNADMAMYRAKDLGKNTYAFFDDEISARVKRRHELDVQMYQAIDNNEFEMYYQPQVSSKTQKIVGVEALIRWHNPVLGEVMPGEFISIAEDNGLIERLGEVVLRNACMEYEQLIPFLETQDHLLSVNVSVRQLENLNFVQEVSNLLRSHPFLTDHLVLEVTESALMKDPQKAIVIMQGLAKYGITFALDDFGIGHSSMQYLKELPIKHIKIDQSFVRDLTHDSDDAAIVNAIIGLAHNLGLHTVAEGVETIEQVNYLIEAGCENLQGYYYYKPMPMKMLIQQLK
jgi:diguanylate cyclase (GGDEF)-like protein/PAS domain S-box-containing protein